MSKQTEHEAGVDSLAELLHETTDWAPDRCQRVAQVIASFGEAEWWESDDGR